MKKLLYIYLLLSVLRCKNDIKSSQEKDKNGISINFEEDSNTQTSSESGINNHLFHLIRNKQEIPDNLPKKPENLERLRKEAVSRLKLNPEKIKPYEEYFLEEYPFLNANIENLDLQIYYHVQHGNALFKKLRINQENTRFDIVLSANIPNGLNGQTISTEFINDSIFIENRVFEKTLKDDTEMMEYAYDSIVTKYHYDSKLNFRQISKDTFNYNIEIITKSKTALRRLKIYSKPFQFQGTECIWEFSLTNSNPSSKYNCYKSSIIEIKSKKVILDGSVIDVDMCDYTSNLFSSNLSLPELTDINFDGYGDILLYNNVASGSAGGYSDSYVYNPEKKVFEYSELYSGYNLEVDNANKTLSQFAKGGGGIFFVQKIHFDNEGKVRFQESFRNEELQNQYVTINGVEYSKYTFNYEQIKNGNIIKKTIDTVELTGADLNAGAFFKWVSDHDPFEKNYIFKECHEADDYTFYEKSELETKAKITEFYDGKTRITLDLKLKKGHLTDYWHIKEMTMLLQSKTGNNWSTANAVAIDKEYFQSFFECIQIIEKDGEHVVVQVDTFKEHKPYSYNQKFLIKISAQTGTIIKSN